jgi:hypothetical protein
VLGTSLGLPHNSGNGFIDTSGILIHVIAEKSRDCMKILAWRTACVSAVIVAMTCAVSATAWAGGAGFGDDDDNSEEEGPSYFGFVRDSNGATVPGAKVTVGVKGRGGVITRTDLLGTYKVQIPRTSKSPATSLVTSRFA